MNDGSMTDRVVGIRAGLFWGRRVLGITAPPSILRVLDSDYLFGVPEGDLDFPAPGEMDEQLFGGAFVIGAEVSPVVDGSFWVSGDYHAYGFCSGDAVPQAHQGFDENGDLFAVDGDGELLPGDCIQGSELLRGGEFFSFEWFSASSLVWTRRRVERSIHVHGARQGGSGRQVTGYCFA